MDVLNIKEFAVKSRIGIHAWEQAIEQTLLIDVSIPFNAENCVDDLQSTGHGFRDDPGVDGITVPGTGSGKADRKR